MTDKKPDSLPNTLTGACHCGGVVFTIPADTDLASATRCDCSYCRRRWAPTASVPADAVEVVKGEELLTLYQFHTKVAEHYFCSRCGNYTFHRRRIDPGVFGVNVGCFEGVAMADYDASPIADGVNHPSDGPGDG